MSKHGQYVFTGISDQADIAFSYLLEAVLDSKFQKMIIESVGWEDFTLVFEDRIEDFEVKSYSKPLAFNDIKGIVSKAIGKNFGEKDKLKIVTREITKELEADFKNVRTTIEWGPFCSKKNITESDIFQKFVRKGWSNEEIKFLIKTEIIEFHNIGSIHKSILEYFATKEPFYLTEDDARRLAAEYFKTLMTKGRVGGSIDRQEFRKVLDSFKLAIVDQSESFRQEISLGKKIDNLEVIGFFKDEKGLEQLNANRYLKPISDSPRLIFYIADSLEKSQFTVESFDFFLRKILLKNHYIRLAVRLLEVKLKQGKAADQYLVNFITENYRLFIADINFDEVIKMLRNIAERDTVSKYEATILNFLKREVLKGFISKKARSKERRGWDEDEEAAKLINIYLSRSQEKLRYIDFIFTYYDFTSDDYENVHETDPAIYRTVKDFIQTDPSVNFEYAVKKISKQYDLKYDGGFKGYEWIGSGISRRGNSFFITDKGVVRLLFAPLFSEMYQKNKEKAWDFFVVNVLSAKRVTKNNPIFLKRALIPTLIQRLMDESLEAYLKTEAFEYLSDILCLKRGIPSTSDMIFSYLRGNDLSKIGFDKVFELVEVDSKKYLGKNKKEPAPSSLFAVSVLIKLIKLGFPPAKQFFLKLLKIKNFVRYDQSYNTVAILISENIAETDPNFALEVFQALSFESYLDSLPQNDIVWDKSEILTGLIKADWKEGGGNASYLINSFLGEHKTPSEKVLSFIAGPIRDLSKINAEKTYELFKKFLSSKDLFRKKFQNNAYARQSFIALAEELIAIKKCDDAISILDLCIDDPDPNTDEGNLQRNYHALIKAGEKESIIVSVRGALAWALQKLVVTNEPRWMQYALEKTLILLDLEGDLAASLGYSEPDLYVRQEALVPFIELCHPGRRQILGDVCSALIKNIAFKVLRITNKQIESHSANPQSLFEYLVHIFSHLRDLNTEEAKEALNFFLNHNVEEAYFLFVYFAIYRKEEYRAIEFDSNPFHELFKDVCSHNARFGRSFAWEVWKILYDEKENSFGEFEKTELYWKLLFNKYHQPTYEFLYRALERTLKFPTKYHDHKQLLKDALKRECEFYKNAANTAMLWAPGNEIFEIVLQHSVDDFLELLGCLVGELHAKIHYYSMTKWIEMFKGITPTLSQQIAYEETRKKLYLFYPENFH